MSSVAVFCGSSMGEGRALVATVRAVAAECAARGVRIVFGGSDAGLMGELCRAAVAAEADIVGVTPHHLAAIEPPAEGIRIEYVSSMAERKARFVELADAVLVLPGGVGTLDEAFDTLTGAQLAQHRLPVVFLGPERFWDPLVGLLEHLRAEGFIADERRFAFASDVDRALDLAGV